MLKETTGKLLTYRASAGSGKTYTLALEFICLCLKVGDPGYFRKILAITFTNKAAAELKERILEYMKDLAGNEGTPALMNQVKEACKLDDETVRMRANKVFSCMLFQYADLHVSTIDHFVLGILKAFSKELGLSFDFKVELDQERISDLLIEELMQSIGRDPFITEALVSYSMNLLDEGSSWNPKNDLAKASEHLFKESSSEALELLGAMDDLQLKEALQAMKKDVKISKELIKTKQAKGTQILQDAGLSLDDFEKKSNSLFSLFIRDLEHFSYGLTNTQINSLDETEFAHKKSKNKGTVDAASPALIELCKEIKELCDKVILLQKIYKERLILLLANKLDHILKKLEKEEDISLLSGNNKRIAKVVKGNPAPFIYERLGERYRHFLIDEFQDTSLNQWHNFLPLLDNSLANGNQNLLVGDAKQSIYRWRNSEVEQIIKLPDIHKKEGDEELSRMADVFAFHHLNKDLQTNYRSRPEIIGFNNELFQSLSPSLAPHLRSAYDDVQQGLSKKDMQGYVEMRLMDTEIKLDDCLQLCLEQIHRSIASGYRPGDIGILVRKNKDGQEIARFLESSEIKVNSSESLVLHGSDTVHLILNMLQFVLGRNNPGADLYVLEHLLEQLGKKDAFHSYASAYMKKESETIIQLFAENGHPMDLRNFRQENIYEAAERLCRETWMDDTDPYVRELLDLLFAHCKKSDGSLDAFLEFFYRKKNLSIKAMPDSEAVQIMTVHASKGLQFPVVIIPYWKDKKKANRAPKSWLPWDEQAFPLLPISLDSKLTGTIFEEAYIKEAQLFNMDELNALYVACTRAETRLYLNLIEGGDFYPACSGHFKNRLEDGVLKSGVEDAYIQKKEKEPSTELRKTIYADPKKVVRTSLKKESPYTKAREFGEQVHMILERCDEISEIPVFIDGLGFSLALNQNAKIELEQSVKAALNLESTLELKEKGYICMKEQEVLSPNGKVNRLDRLYLHPSDKSARIVDYKTGFRRDHDDTQMRSYINLIKDMGYDDVKAYLLYTNELELIHVH